MTGGGALLEFAVRVGEPSHAATASDTATDLIYNQPKQTQDTFVSRMIVAAHVAAHSCHA